MLPKYPIKAQDVLVGKDAGKHQFTFDAPACSMLAETFELSAVESFNFTGLLQPYLLDGVQLKATLSAQIVQPCVISLQPVTTVIAEKLERLWIPSHRIKPEETENLQIDDPESDDLFPEPLSDMLDLVDVALEAFALAIPAYPRAPNAELLVKTAAPPGVTPLPEGNKPFSNLTILKDFKIKKDKDA